MQRKLVRYESRELWHCLLPRVANYPLFELDRTRRAHYRRFCRQAISDISFSHDSESLAIAGEKLYRYCNCTSPSFFVLYLIILLVPCATETKMGF